VNLKDSKNNNSKILLLTCFSYILSRIAVLRKCRLLLQTTSMVCRSVCWSMLQ